jgi:hypothetical protein
MHRYAILQTDQKQPTSPVETPAASSTLFQQSKLSLQVKQPVPRCTEGSISRSLDRIGPA